MKINYEDVNYLSNYYADAIHQLYRHNIEVDAELKDAVQKLNESIKKVYDMYDEKIAKPKREAEDKAEHERSLAEDMRIELTHEQADLIQSVLGQMSDGKWESNSSYTKYWCNMNIEDNTLVVNTNKLERAGWSESWKKEYKKNFTSESAIKKWFAHKAKLVLNDALDSHIGHRDIAKVADVHAYYLDSWRDKTVNQTYGQILASINSLL